MIFSYDDTACCTLCLHMFSCTATWPQYCQPITENLLFICFALIGPIDDWRKRITISWSCPCGNERAVINGIQFFQRIRSCIAIFISGGKNVTKTTLKIDLMHAYYFTHFKTLIFVLFSNRNFHSRQWGSSIPGLRKLDPPLWPPINLNGNL